MIVNPRSMWHVLVSAAVLLPGAPLVHAGQDLRPFAAIDHPTAVGRGCQAIEIDHQVMLLAEDRGVCRLAGLPLDGGLTVDLDLETFDVLAPNARRVVMGARGERQLTGEAPRFWRGSVVGDPDSSVFLTDNSAGTFGIVETFGRRFILTTGDPRGDRTLVSWATDGPAADLIEWTPWQCGTANLMGPRPEQGIQSIPTPPMAGSGVSGGSCRVVELAIDTDQEYLALFPNEQAATDYAATLVAAASQIYERDCSVRLSLVYSRIWTTTDPWTQGTTSDQLYEFGNYWFAFMSSVPRDLAHLLSGRSLGGGVAFIGQACEAAGYGLSANLNGSFPTPLQDQSSQNWDIYVFTHELGHNLGSYHTHDPTQYDPVIDDCWNQSTGSPGACTDRLDGTIMSYCHQCPGGLANINLRFHPRVRRVIIEYVAGAGCLADDNSTDCPIQCFPDLNGDGQVGSADLGLLMSAWNSSDPDADLNGDGVVDAYDLSYILGYWGVCTGQ